MAQHVSLQHLACIVAGDLSPYGSGASTASEPRLDCRTCGACCVGAWGTGIDAATRVTRPPGRRWPEWMPDDRIPADVQGRCPGLEGTVGEGVRCREYINRPMECRSFEVGCPECLQAREDSEVGPPGPFPGEYL